MPFRSKQQQKWAYTAEGTKALGGKDKVAEWQSDTPKELPKRVSHPKRPPTYKTKKK